MKIGREGEVRVAKGVLGSGEMGSDIINMGWEWGMGWTDGAGSDGGTDLHG